MTNYAPNDRDKLCSWFHITSFGILNTKNIQWVGWLFEVSFFQRSIWVYRSKRWDGDFVVEPTKTNLAHGLNGCRFMQWPSVVFGEKNSNWGNRSHWVLAIQMFSQAMKTSPQAPKRMLVNGGVRFGERYRHWEMDALRTLVRDVQVWLSWDLGAPRDEF